MRFIPISVALAAALSGCTTPTTPTALSETQIATARAFCRDAATPECRFLNAPVRLTNTPVTIPGRKLTFYPMAEELTFVDGLQQAWIAPRGTLTDGASIPQMFIAIVGSPTSPSFVNAAAIHDAICGIGNEAGPRYHTRPWRDTHRMFYDALRVGGTDELTAKVMFAAVYLGGPRWGVLGATPSQAIPEAALQGAMRQAKTYVGRENPSIPALEAYLDAKLRYLMARVEAGEDRGESYYEGEFDSPPETPDTSDPTDGGTFDPDQAL